MREETLRRFLLFSLSTAAAVGIFYLSFRYLLPWCLPFLLALLVAALLEPVVLHLQRALRFRRGFSALLLTLTLLFLLGGLLSLLGTTLFSQLNALLAAAPAFFDALPEAAEGLLSRLEGSGASGSAWLSRYLREQLMQTVSDMDSLLRSLSARAVAAQADGWQAAMIVVGTICALLFLLCFRLTRERVAPVESPSAGGQSILSDMKSLAGNGPWWILLGVAVAALLFNSIRGGAAAYYFKDFIGEDNLLGGSMILSCGAFLAIGEIANMLGVVLAVPISLRIGKRMTYIWAMAVSGLLSIVFFFMPTTVAGCWAMVVLQIVISAAAGITFPLLWSMYADVADYSELKHGHGSTGLIFSSSSMAQKFGGAFGSALILWLLASYGYDTSGAAVQNGEAIFGLRMLMSWLPAAGCALAVLLVAIYPLNETRISEIGEKLALRRAANK